MQLYYRFQVFPIFRWRMHVESIFIIRIDTPNTPHKIEESFPAYISPCGHPRIVSSACSIQSAPWDAFLKCHPIKTGCSVSKQNSPFPILNQYAQHAFIKNSVHTVRRFPEKALRTRPQSPRFPFPIERRRCPSK